MGSVEDLAVAFVAGARIVVEMLRKYSDNGKKLVADDRKLSFAEYQKEMQVQSNLCTMTPPYYDTLYTMTPFSTPNDPIYQ